MARRIRLDDAAPRPEPELATGMTAESLEVIRQVFMAGYAAGHYDTSNKPDKAWQDSEYFKGYHVTRLAAYGVNIDQVSMPDLERMLSDETPAQVRESLLLVFPNLAPVQHVAVDVASEPDWTAWVYSHRSDAGIHIIRTGRITGNSERQALTPEQAEEWGFISGMPVYEDQAREFFQQIEREYLEGQYAREMVPIAEAPPSSYDGLSPFVQRLSDGGINPVQPPWRSRATASVLDTTRGPHVSESIIPGSLMIGNQHPSEFAGYQGEVMDGRTPETNIINTWFDMSYENQQRGDGKCRRRPRMPDGTMGPWGEWF